MLKEFKSGKALFPMPVLIISTYNEDGSVDCMNAAWGTMEDTDVILIELTPDHKTSQNMERNKAFSVAFCDKDNVIPGDYVGIVSGNKEKDKFQRTGWSVTKASQVNAPLINELPISLQCQLLRIDTTNNDYVVYGKIVATAVREDVLDEQENVDLDSCQLITYNSADHSYRVLGQKVAPAFKVGLKLK